MLTRLSRLGVPVVDYDEQALTQEVATGASWVKRPAMPVRRKLLSPMLDF